MRYRDSFKNATASYWEDIIGEHQDERIEAALVRHDQYHRYYVRTGNLPRRK